VNTNSLTHLLTYLQTKISSKPYAPPLSLLGYMCLLLLQLEDFLPVMKLYDLLYPETEPLRLPNINSSSCTFKMAVTSIWIHLSKKAQNERLQRPIPHALSTHIEYEQIFSS